MPWEAALEKAKRQTNKQKIEKKLLEENTGINLCELESSNGFLGITQSASNKRKNKQAEFHQNEKLSVSKDSIEKVKAHFDPRSLSEGLMAGHWLTFMAVNYFFIKLKYTQKIISTLSSQ